ncbi:pnp [Symbiodinium pilosum]|uniref:Pnp protein n=1 Tax=Symbiodinium pilosum TaxID=2952 RepID=A0A812Q949_SYMPI|nr:pnp [Symbiodinium pilosum]
MALYEDKEEGKEHEVSVSAVTALVQFTAVVQCHNGDETYLITWAEDGYEHTQSASNMRLLKRTEKRFRFSAGNKVEGFYHDEEKWYTARIKCVNDSGSYTVIWDEDGEEYELQEEDLKLTTLPIRLSDLKPHQKFTGTVARTFSFGTFVDIGAERDGLLKPWFTFEGEEPTYKQGDKVKAFYEEDEEYYEATVLKDNGDGTCHIAWEEDDVEYTADTSKMELIRLAELEEGSKVDVFVESVMTDKDGQQRLWLATIKDKIGSKGPKPKVDLSGFSGLSGDMWLKGTVTRILNFGAFVSVAPPSGGQPAQGLVHKNEVRDGFIHRLEEEMSVDDEVEVRIKHVNPDEGVLQLSMLGG